MKINSLKNDALNNNIYMKKFIFKVKKWRFKFKNFLKKTNKKTPDLGVFYFIVIEHLRC